MSDSELEREEERIFEEKKVNLIKLLENNDEKILNKDLNNGWEVVRERAGIFDDVIKWWFTDYVSKRNYQRPFALVTLGGYGRSELTPNSDIDLRLLVDDIVSEDNKFAYNAMEDILYKIPKLLGENFNSFSFKHLVHNLEDIKDKNKFEMRDYNAFLDMRVLYDSEGFSTKFREEVRKVVDPLELLFHNRGIWTNIRDENPEVYDDLKSFNIKEDGGGLRSFQLGLWVQAINDFQHSSSVYERLENENPKLLESAGFLMKMRSWLHLHKENIRLEGEYERIKNAKVEEEKKILPKNENDIMESDVMLYKDFREMGKVFGNHARERLLSARRRIHNFTEGLLHERWRKGVVLGNPLVVCGINGLYPNAKLDNKIEELSEEELKIKNNSLYSCLLESQKRDIPIDPATKQTSFRYIEDWIKQGCGFGKLFYARGKLSRSLNELTSRNVMDQIVPGYSKLEASIPETGHKGQYLTRTRFGIQKLETLENITSEGTKHEHLKEEYDSLDVNLQAGLRLALWLKRMPEVLDRPIRDYLYDLGKNNGFNNETIENSLFLINNHETIINSARERLSDGTTVGKIAEICNKRERLKALHLFTHADNFMKQESKDDPHIMFNVNELYKKANHQLAIKEGESIQERQFNRMYFDEVGEQMINDLGPDFLEGGYGGLADNWIPILSKVYRTKNPTVKFSRTRDTSPLTVACEDYPGLIPVITGRLFKEGAELMQCTAYTLSRHSLAFDFFEINFKDREQSEIIRKSIEEVIKKREFLDIDPKDFLGPMKKEVKFEELKDSGYLRLTFNTPEDKQGILYALTYTLFKKADANIYRVGAFADRNRSDNVQTNSIYFRTRRSFEETMGIVRENIG